MRSPFVIIAFAALTAVAWPSLAAQIPVGPPNTGIGGGGAYTFYTDGLVFDVQAPLTINTMDTYPQGAGSVVINLMDSAGLVLQSVTATATGAGVLTVPVGFFVPPGTGYRLDANGTNVAGGLYRTTAGAVYPYTVPGLVSITGPINNLTGFYYFFYNWDVFGGVTAPSWQVNSPALTFSVGTANTSGYARPVADAFVNVAAPMVISTTEINAPFELLLRNGPLTPSSFRLPGSGQIFNINPTAIDTVFFTGLRFLPLTGTINTTITPVSPGMVSAQAVILSPSNPDGLVVSQGVQLTVSADFQLGPSAGCQLGPGTPLALTDDSFSQQNLGFGFPMYGSVYTSVFVGSNGHMTFGAGNNGWATGASGLTTNLQPIIAPCSEDFNPAAGGSVTFFTDNASTFEVCWIGVPSFGTVNSNTFAALATAGAFVQFNYDVMQDGEGTVGMAAGSNLGTTETVDYSRIGGINGAYALPANADPTQDFAALNFDLGGYQVNFLLDSQGTPILIY